MVEEKKSSNVEEKEKKNPSDVYLPGWGGTLALKYFVKLVAS